MKENACYRSINGVIFSKDGSELILCPERKPGEYTIPGSVTSIGDRAFGGCSSLTSVTIPDGVTSIGEWAFDGFRSLTSVAIPSSVTHIYGCAFDGCKNLACVYYGGNRAGWNAVRVDYEYDDVENRCTRDCNVELKKAEKIFTKEYRRAGQTIRLIVQGSAKSRSDPSVCGS